MTQKTKKKIMSWLNKQILACYNRHLEIDGYNLTNIANREIQVTYDIFNLIHQLTSWDIKEYERDSYDYPIELYMYHPEYKVAILTLLDIKEVEDYRNGKNE